MHTGLRVGPTCSDQCPEEKEGGGTHGEKSMRTQGGDRGNAAMSRGTLGTTEKVEEAS